MTYQARVSDDDSLALADEVACEFGLRPGDMLSFGDRACLALGKALGLSVLTADRKWHDLDIGVDIRLIR